ncbi:MAG TPA: SusD/RagB family nutrient-binding outer membrane lipoprotein [Gemmatimonadales bacterium]|nr:SusD/RagB family nutrient-binding outer membrane lipoprotein [Gemmatimonadales bacterium]
MRKITTAVFVAALTLAAACHDFLDVNVNPNTPQSVAANLYLPPMLFWMATAPQYDGRFVGHYTQEWVSTSTNFSPAQSWGRMGYDAGSDAGGEQWRDVYWSLGQGLIDMNAKATAEQRWDLLGVGLVLKAWGWQVLTDLHGPIIIKEAFDQSRTTFDYDSQDYAYQEVERLLDSAIVLLRRSDGAVNQAYLAQGDHIYNGDRMKWLRFAHGLLALHLNHFSNKATYDRARVMAEVDSSFTGNADDALMSYTGVSPDNLDRNFWGRTRGNLTLYRQTQFIVNLMNGTAFGGGTDSNAVDPRMSRILAPSPDGQYRGLDINVLGFGALTAAQQPNNFYGYAGSGGLGLPGRYLFDDKAKIPVMTYAQLQFVKAEAALLAGNQAIAKTAYINGISASIDFVNARNLDAGQTPSQITGTQKATFLADTNIVPATLTLSHIMSQKVIAQFGWGHNEMWMDMRRYHYADTVFRGFAPPTALFSDNGGLVVQRIRPRYNSEYVWNRTGLHAIPGDGLSSNYHTVEMWITTNQP